MKLGGKVDQADLTLLLENAASERQTLPPAEDVLFDNEREGNDGG